MRALPPTEDAFKQQLLRSLYATLALKQAHLKVPVLPPPTSFDIVQSLISGNCYNSRCKRYCTCKRAQVPCCLVCKRESKKGKYERVDTLRNLNENALEESDIDAI